MLYEGAKISSLIGQMDGTNRLVRTLFQAVQDHGGDTPDLNRLITEASGHVMDLPLMSEIAKLVVGPIWELTRERKRLEPVDFNCSTADFCVQYPFSTVRIVRDDPPQRYLTMKKPEVDPECCLYILAHLGSNARSFDLVQAIGDGNFNYDGRSGIKAEPANWRELWQYCHQFVRPEMLGNRHIVAAGSRLMHTMLEHIHGEGAERELIATKLCPVMSVDRGSGQLYMDWRGGDERDRAARASARAFDATCFHLVRLTTV